MLKSFDVDIHIETIKQPSKQELQKLESFVGHEDIAAIVGVEYHRAPLTLEGDDELIICQYVGGRLQVGTKELPEGARIDWARVTLSYKK